MGIGVVLLDYLLNDVEILLAVIGEQGEQFGDILLRGYVLAESESADGK